MDRLVNAWLVRWMGGWMDGWMAESIDEWQKAGQPKEIFESARMTVRSSSK